MAQDYNEEILISRYTLEYLLRQMELARDREDTNCKILRELLNGKKA